MILSQPKIQSQLRNSLSEMRQFQQQLSSQNIDRFGQKTNQVCVRAVCVCVSSSPLDLL